MLRDDAGFVSAKVLLLLVCFGAITAGAAVVMRQAAVPLARLKAGGDTEQALAQAVGRFWVLLREDPTPFSDSPGDPVWRLDGMVMDGWQVSLEDASSRWNLQWNRLRGLEGTALAAGLLPGKTLDDLERFRHSRGGRRLFRPMMPFGEPRAGGCSPLMAMRMSR